MIGTRIRQARLAASLTLDELGLALEVSHTTIQKFENGKLTPSSGQLYKLAKACSVRTEYFFRSNEVQLQNIEFRKLASLGKRKQESIELSVKDLVAKHIELFNLFSEPPLPCFHNPLLNPSRIESVEECEELSLALRNRWGLGENSIGNLTKTLENHGIIVGFIDPKQDQAFIGLKAVASAKDGKQCPVVIVEKHWPGDRQRFTLAHELAHLILEGRVSQDINIEAACDRFAGAFLLPGKTLVQNLGSTRKAINVNELSLLKKDFGISQQAVLVRAFQCGIINRDSYLKTIRLFSAKGWRKKEPGPQLPPETSTLFAQLVHRARSEGLIGDSKAAEFLGIPTANLDNLDLPNTHVASESCGL